MFSPLEYADNIVLHFRHTEMKMDTKVWTTGDVNRFKVGRGTDAGNRMYDTTFINMYDLESMAIDHIINGYELKVNWVFKDGIDGVVKRRVGSLDWVKPPLVSVGTAVCDRTNGDDETPIKVIYDGLVEQGIVEPSDN